MWLQALVVIVSFAAVYLVACHPTLPGGTIIAIGLLMVLGGLLFYDLSQPKTTTTMMVVMSIGAIITVGGVISSFRISRYSKSRA